ncbi:glycosyltransferase family 4 protein [uncultured Algibacter sp.]|uniref:glycosyltransferase family 4 protein n=1 Tax=uncultured Algibacter sp. TaxID=298659 RepID=UPI002634096F|nr:glycosyltransferase family 4 protein [uncultured Algibacter sp.]
MKKKIIKVTAVPASLVLLKGQLKFLSNYFEIIGVTSPAGDYIAKISEREGVYIEAIEIQRRISLITDLKSLWHLYKFFKAEKPFIVHSITPKAGLLSMIAAYLAGVPNRIHTFTGLIFPIKKGFSKKILILTDKILCFCATQIFPEGIGVKNDLINYKITTKPLKVIANGNINGIDITYFNPNQFNISSKKNLKKQLLIDDNDFIFIFIGRLVKDKGVNELVKSFKLLNKKNKNTKLLLVGDFEDELDPLDLQTTLEIRSNNNIIFTSWVDDVRPYLSIADVLTFPSYREGFPNVVLQAGAMGLPSIVTDINGSNEIIIEGVNGTIIPPQSENALYCEMLKSYNKQTIYDKGVCRELIVEKYEQQIVWRAILEEYQKLVKNCN